MPFIYLLEGMRHVFSEGIGQIKQYFCYKSTIITGYNWMAFTWDVHLLKRSRYRHDCSAGICSNLAHFTVVNLTSNRQQLKPQATIIFHFFIQREKNYFNIAHTNFILHKCLPMCKPHGSKSLYICIYIYIYIYIYKICYNVNIFHITARMKMFLRKMLLDLVWLQQQGFG